MGAIVQAIEAIYKVLKWIFENAARLFSFVETVVNGMADIIAGNVSGMANAVEQALAQLLAPVIDFFAGFLGLGNLPDRIADTIRGFQEWVESILERVIAWLAERARALLRSLGIGGEEEEIEEEETAGDYIYETSATGGHTIKIRQDLTVLRFSDPSVLTGEEAQEKQQKALESIVPRVTPDYPTDSLERAEGPSGHVIDVKDGEGRESLPAVKNLPGGVPAYQPGDHRGHLIGDRFHGSSGAGNLVPMHPTLNLSTFKSYENTLATKYKTLFDAGKGVLLFMHISPHYPDNDSSNPASFRPDSITANSKIITLKEGATSLTKEEEVFKQNFPNPGAVLTDVDLNTADETTLRAINLSPRLVNVILREREVRGKFRSPDDLSTRLAYALGEPYLHLYNELIARANILILIP